MAVTGAIVAVGTVASGVMTSMAANKAGKAAEGAFNDALSFQKGVYNTAQENLGPWMKGGQEALGGLEGFMGLQDTSGYPAAGSGALASYKQFTETPFYTFPERSMTAAMDRAAAAKGMSMSTGQVADLGRMSGNYAASNFGSYISALERLSGVGKDAAANISQVGTNIGQQVGATESGIANTRANSIMAQQAGINQAIMGGTSLLGGALTGNFPGFTQSGYGGGQGGGTGSGGLIGYMGGNNGGFGNYTGPSNAANPQYDPMGIFRTGTAGPSFAVPSGSYYQTGPTYS